MTPQNFYEMLSNYEEEQLAELKRVKIYGTEKGCQYADRVDFSHSDYWFCVDIYAATGRIYGHYFACQSLDALKEAITWVVSETKFHEAVAFVKDKAYVTFRNQGDIDTFDDYFRDYFRFAEDVKETCPELADRLFTKEQLERVYETVINKKEYPEFDDWLQDMCRSGLVYSCHRRFVPSKKERISEMNDEKEKSQNREGEQPAVYPPVYKESFSYAREHGEMDAFQSSNRLNDVCSTAIEEAISSHFDGMRLNEKAVDSVMERFGTERVAFVLAATVLYKSYDGRFSWDNKSWAVKTCPRMAAEMNKSNPVQLIQPHTLVTSHPAVLDGFINLFRAEVKLMEQIPVEKMLLNGSADSFGIYQINRDSAGREYLFEGTKLLQKLNHKVNGADYNLIYVSNLSKTETLSEVETLDMIFERFNMALPEDFKGHSLSVSDVILMNQDGKTKAWYVDSVGFTELPDFVQERRMMTGSTRTTDPPLTEKQQARNPPQDKEKQKNEQKSDRRPEQKQEQKQKKRKAH
ncbi:MAG: DUF3849 domain-containing protein [Lachnospiraceae bacterium]|nr:DUF3849 domain-containing protein [Lachnospiraceae bacterium]